MLKARLLLASLVVAVIASLVYGTTAQAHTPRWWVREALCVHRYEGSWRDPNAPYYGGMQMDWSFMATYGPGYLRRWGTADHWPVWAQLWVAYKAYSRGGRGWHPWPNTARYCGLL